MTYHLVENVQHPVIKVFGVGAAGCRAVRHMKDAGLEGAEFVWMESDERTPYDDDSETRILLRASLSTKVGAAVDPELGRLAAIESRQDILDALAGVDLVFIVVGMGGSTGTGAAPFVAQMAREVGVLTIAVVTSPFPFEGRQRMEAAKAGIERLEKCTDSVIVIRCAKLLESRGSDMSLVESYSAADQVIAYAVSGVSDLITRPGLINVDFTDVKEIVAGSGLSLMGRGSAAGSGRAIVATRMAVSSPLFDEFEVKDARAVLVNITCGMSLSMREFEDVSDIIQDIVGERSALVGTVIDPEIGDEINVTVFAIGETSGRVKPAELARRVSEEGGRAEVFDGIDVYFPEYVKDGEVAEFLIHLSNVYRSVGGDQLELHAACETPPPDGKRVWSGFPQVIGKRGLG